MSRFHEPDLGRNPDDPFARDVDDKLIRRAFWLDMSDRSLVLAMTQGVGAPLSNDHKRAHLARHRPCPRDRRCLRPGDPAAGEIVRADTRYQRATGATGRRRAAWISSATPASISTAAAQT